MPRQLYRNNLSTALAQPCSSADTTIVVQNAAQLPPLTNDLYWMVLTLVSPNDPAVFEIVKLVRHDAGSTSLTVERGHEFTTPRSWAAGTIVQARLTAGTLEQLVQNTHNVGGLRLDSSSSSFDPSGGGDSAVEVGVRVRAPGESAVAVGAGCRADGFGSVAVGNSARAHGANSIAIGQIIATLPYQLAVLAHPCVLRDDWVAGYGSYYNAGMESIFASAYCELGTPATWAANTQYLDGDTVRPTVSDGIQYTLWNGIYAYAEPPNTVLSGGTEPEWPGTAGGDAAVTAGEELNSEGDRAHWWVALDPLAGLKEIFPEGMVFYPTEVGFICFNHGGVTAAPLVSIGTAAEPGLLVDNQPLSGITGPAQRHAFTGLKHGITDIQFQLITPAAGAGARFHGRFYAKGMFIQRQG